MRFSGASEQIRAQRIQSAQGVLGQVGGASILPSASEFLQLGAQRAQSAANVETSMSQAEASLRASRQQAIYSGIGQLVGMGVGFAGGAGLLGAGIQGMLGGAPGVKQALPYSTGGGSYANLGALSQYYDPMTGRNFPIFGGGKSSRLPFGYGSYGGGFGNLGSPQASYSDPYYYRG